MTKKAKKSTKAKREVKRRNPAKTALNKALREWRLRALHRADHKCEWCGSTEKGLNCHHIIDRRYKPLIVSDHNSIVLCPTCHKFGIGKSAHSNPIRMSEWLKQYRPDSWEVLAKITSDMVPPNGKPKSVKIHLNTEGTSCAEADLDSDLNILQSIDLMKTIDNKNAKLLDNFSNSTAPTIEIQETGQKSSCLMSLMGDKCVCASCKRYGQCFVEVSFKSKCPHELITKCSIYEPTGDDVDAKTQREIFDSGRTFIPIVWCTYGRGSTKDT